MAMLTKEMEAYLLESQEDLRQLIRELCAIPAPSHHEEHRAAYVKNWLLKAGAADVKVDEANNVICTLRGREPGPLAVTMAHMDTVFPDTEPMPFLEDKRQFRCPGVTDDTAQLAVLLIAARYFIRAGLQPRHTLLVVANAAEEGLGNLKGSRRIVQDYGNQMAELVTFDGVNLHEIVSKAVGSHRWKVTVETEGGHSFGDFGKPNAIAALADLIHELYGQPIPREGDSKTTYNVGVISGGTSVNTIAQQAEMLWEYRSDSRACMEQMQRQMEEIFAAHNRDGVTIRYEKIGDRPCAGDVDETAQQALFDRAERVLRRNLTRDVVFRSGSTDCNAAVGAGIPAVCLGACIGGGCHTRQEYLELQSLLPGSRQVLDFLSEYFSA